MSIPEDYQRGYKQFLNCKIDLSFKPLIPREETEYWVGEVLKELPEGCSCLDLFSGSGCIGISILKNVQNSVCDFGEIDRDLLKQIKLNLDLNGIEENRYNIIETDVFSNIIKRYDYVFANPPYVAESRIKEVGKDVLRYEPHRALFGGGDGMFFINKLIEEGYKYFSKKMFIEIDPSQKIIKDNYRLIKDQFGEVRVVEICGNTFC